MPPARSRLFPLLAILAACQGDHPALPARPAVYPAFSIVGNALWAGAELSLRMRGPGERPATATLVLLYNIRVPLAPLDDSTMTGIVPQHAVGVVQDVRLEIGAFDTLLDPILVAGKFGQWTQSLNLAQGHVYGTAHRPGSGRFLVGIGNGSDAVLHLSDWPTLLGVAAHQMTAPGPTLDPDVWLLRSAPNGPLERWRLSDTPLLLETLPFHGNGPWQTVAELGDDLLLAIDGDGGRILQRSAAGDLGDNAPYQMQRPFRFTGLNRVVISPRGDRAAMTAFTGIVDWGLPNAAPGIPVFRLPDGEVAYQFDGDKAVTSVDFSPDGSLLAVATGSDYLSAGSIQIRDAATGVIQRQLHSDRRVFRGLAFDPHRPLLYVVSVASPPDAGSMPPFELEVWSTTDWQLRARFDARCLLGCLREVLIVIGPWNEIYTIETTLGSSDERLVTHSFRVPRTP